MREVLFGELLKNIMKHMLKNDNIGILTTKSFRDNNFAHTFCTKNISEAINLSPKTASNAMNLPLYLYPDDNSLDSSRVPNLDMSIVKEIEKSLGLEFVAEPHPADKSAPLSRGEYSLKTNVGVVPCADPHKGQTQGIAPTTKSNGHTREGGYLTNTSNNARDSRLHGNDGSINSPSDMKGWQSK